MHYMDKNVQNCILTVDILVYMCTTLLNYE